MEIRWGRFRLEPVGVVLQASMSTGSVPGLMTQMAAGKSYLQHQLERVLATFKRSDCVVVTTELRENQAILQICQDLRIPFYVGDRDDALGNCMRAAQRQGFRSVMLLRSDSPLIDPALLDLVRLEYLGRGDGTNYVSNRLKRTYPTGMEVEITGLESLVDSYMAASNLADFSDPTRLLRRGDLSHCRTVDVVQAVDHSQWRFRLDTGSDHQQLSTLLERVQDYSLHETMRVAEAHGLLVREPQAG
jgi:spore coat polysaccharide biosynthesis protein SpsF